MAMAKNTKKALNKTKMLAVSEKHKVRVNHFHRIGCGCGDVFECFFSPGRDIETEISSCLIFGFEVKTYTSKEAFKISNAFFSEKSSVQVA